MRTVRRLPLLVAFAASLYGADALRVMTFDVRYPLTSDGPNSWYARRDIMNAMIRNCQPDLFGTQELFQIQGDYFVDKLTAFTWFGLSRFGNHQDEHAGIFYRKSRFEMFDSGNFWLSDRPDSPGSVSWNAGVPYMATWGDFVDKKTGRRFRWYNTYFPQRPEDAEARANSARELALRIRGLSRSMAVILTGDFSAGVTSEPHTILTGTLTDAYSDAPKRSGPIGTYHAFTGKPGPGRIDWILYRGALKPVSIETIAYNEKGRYPSDHFPVMAVFEWK